VNILNVGYDSTNYYLLEIEQGMLLVDCGWPGTLPKFLAVLKRKDVPADSIKYLLVTHFHPDHSGLTQDLKNRGTRLILMESQVSYTSAMDELYESKNLPYLPITGEGNILLRFDASRKFLAGLGLEGEILPAPGHSDDSVALVLDEGFAFTGDLPPRFMLPEEDKKSRQSWERINERKIKQIFPGHGG
jgi:endoribonuclease LACTB2